MTAARRPRFSFIHSFIHSLTHSSFDSTSFIYFLNRTYPRLSSHLYHYIYLFPSVSVLTKRSTEQSVIGVCTDSVVRRPIAQISSPRVSLHHKRWTLKLFELVTLWLPRDPWSHEFAIMGRDAQLSFWGLSKQAGNTPQCHYASACVQIVDSSP